MNRKNHGDEKKFKNKGEKAKKRSKYMVQGKMPEWVDNGKRKRKSSRQNVAGKQNEGRKKYPKCVV